MWACGGLLACSHPASAARYERAPYVQSVTRDGALIVLGLDAPCPVRVFLSDETAHVEREFPSEAQGTWHVVPLTGLTAGASYSYAVEACGVRRPAVTFRTAPEPEHLVHFAAVGDSGTGDAAQRAVIAAIQSAAPEFLLALGDNAYEAGTRDEYQQKFFAPMEALLGSVPVYATLGNHEYSTREGQPFLDNFYLPANNPRGTERYYSFDWGDVHLVSLDSSCVLGLAPEELCTTVEQQQWLAGDLAASQARWKVVFLHHPPWSSGRYGSFTEVRQAFGQLFEEGGVDLVLSGHEHDYERAVPMRGAGQAAPGVQGVTYAVVGTGGASLRPFPSQRPDWSAARSAAEHGFLDVRIDGDTLVARMMTAGGTSLDSFTLTKPPRDSGLTLSATAAPQRGPAPLEVRLEAVTGDADSEVRWTMGATGATVTGHSATHVFTEPGTVEVSVTAVQGDRQATRTLQIVVDAPVTEETPSPAPPDDAPEAPPAPVAEAPRESSCGLGLAAALPTLLLGWFVHLRGRKRSVP
jgi:hypothetical protein